VFYAASNGFAFTAISGEVIDTNHITLVLNGVDVSSSLSIVGNNTKRHGALQRPHIEYGLNGDDHRDEQQRRDDCDGAVRHVRAQRRAGDRSGGLQLRRW
jgi:hypothetical protein